MRDPDYKLTSQGGRTQLLHRYIYEQHYGAIPAGYHVHHKNGVKSDNEISNLEIKPSKEHLSEHSKAEKNPMFGQKGSDHPGYGKPGNEYARALKSPEVRAKMSQARKNFWASKTKEERTNIVKKGHAGRGQCEQSV